MKNEYFVNLFADLNLTEEVDSKLGDLIEIYIDTQTPTSLARVYGFLHALRAMGLISAEQYFAFRDAVDESNSLESFKANYLKEMATVETA